MSKNSNFLFCSGGPKKFRLSFVDGVGLEGGRGGQKISNFFLGTERGDWGVGVGLGG